MLKLLESQKLYHKVTRCLSTKAQEVSGIRLGLEGIVLLLIIYG